MARRSEPSSRGRSARFKRKPPNTCRNWHGRTPIAAADRTPVTEMGAKADGSHAARREKPETASRAPRGPAAKRTARGYRADRGSDRGDRQRYPRGDAVAAVAAAIRDRGVNHLVP